MKKWLFTYLGNKYIATAVGFLVWVTFFDDIDLIYVTKSKLELKEMENRVVQLREASEKAEYDLHNLTTNSANLEQFAREEYLMKRDNEDLFIVREKKLK